MSSLLKINGISKTYKKNGIETRAIANMELSIYEKEFVSICGISGCGKTTLLNIMGCVDIPDEGTYEINGEMVNYKDKKCLEYYRKNMFGFVFQDYALMKNYSVAENIIMPLIAKNIKGKERKKRVRFASEMLGIEETLDKYPTELSGGQQQRVAIARVLAMGNKVILADEPTGSLDEDNSNALIDIFKAMQKQGYTIVMVTHDSRLAEKTDRIIYMEKPLSNTL